MILQLLQIIATELRVAADNPARIDEGDPTGKGGARSIRERVRVRTDVPLGRDEPSFALELAPCFLRQRFSEPASRDDHDARDKQQDQPEKPEEKSFGECHADRDCPPLSR